MADRRPDLNDQLVGPYCDWRVRCLDVRAAYARFAVAPAADRALAFAAYEAALDREASAAHVYAQQIRRLDRAAHPRSRRSSRCQKRAPLLTPKR